MEKNINIFQKNARSKGISLVELLLSAAMFSLAIMFIVQAVCLIFSSMVKARIYHMGMIAVHEKIEHYRAMHFSGIVAGEFMDSPHLFISRRWTIKENSRGYTICVFSYSNGDYQLYQFCTERTGYE